MSDENETTDTTEPTDAERAEAEAAGIVTEPANEPKPKKPSRSRKKAQVDAPQDEPALAKTAPDGLPSGGNRDDAAELDMGLRTPEMGPVPGGVKTDAPETPEQKIARLESENATLRAGLQSLVPAEAQKAMGIDPAKGGGNLARAGEKSEPALPGEGPVKWQGFIEKNKLFHAAAPFQFRGSESEAEAREAYLRLNGIKATTGKVIVQRVP